KIVHLPGCYQANDPKRQSAPLAPTRSDIGLPEGAVIFTCFSNAWKLSRPMIGIWSRLLGTCPNSVLWLYHLNESALANIQQELLSLGIDPARVILAPFVEQPDHLARLGLADLFLDTLPYNAHTTANDALWAGVPVLTCKGSTFAGRVAASTLEAVGLPELITNSLDEYEALAVKLAGDPALLGSLRERLAQNRLSRALFDTARLTRHGEAAYVTMWETCQRCEPPQSFSVDRIKRAATEEALRERAAAGRRAAPACARCLPGRALGRRDRLCAPGAGHRFRAGGHASPPRHGAGTLRRAR